MNFLETVGLLTVIIIGFFLLSAFLQTMRENDRKMEEDRLASAKTVAEYNKRQEKILEIEKEKEIIAKENFEKQNVFIKKWENMSQKKNT